MLTEDRTLRNNDLPANSCAYVAAIDAMTGNTSFRHLTIEEFDEPALVSALRRNLPKSNLPGRTRALMLRLQAAAPALIGTQLENLEDPFLIIQTIRGILRPYHRGIIVEPLIKSPCGQSNCPTIIGDLEFSKDPITGKYRPHPP